MTLIGFLKLLFKIQFYFQLHMEEERKNVDSQKSQTNVQSGTPSGKDQVGKFVFPNILNFSLQKMFLFIKKSIFVKIHFPGPQANDLDVGRESVDAQSTHRWGWHQASGSLRTGILYSTHFPDLSFSIKNYHFSVKLRSRTHLLRLMKTDVLYAKYETYPFAFRLLIYPLTPCSAWYNARLMTFSRFIGKVTSIISHSD